VCGIVGIFLAPQAADPRRLAAIEPMAMTSYHRGPDSGGVWIEGNAGIALGHRRLAIVDLSIVRHPIFRFAVTLALVAGHAVRQRSVVTIGR
jgi:asparagine synthase (glutamine-hydrolysing)